VTCEDYASQRKHWLKKMWATPVFTKERARYERKANEAARKYAACKKDRHNRGSKPARGGYPKQPPEVLWRMDPQRRPVDIFGVISGNLMGGEDEVIAVAKGARTSFKNRPADDRATIRGGLAILRAAGKSGINPDGLKSQIVQGSQEDRKLVHAAGGGTDLKSAANHVRKRVKALGPSAERAAWGMRGLYVLQNLKGLAVGRGVGSGVASAFGPIGMAVAAAMSIHGAVSGAVAKEAASRFTGYVKSYHPEVPAATQVPAGRPSSTPAKQAPAPPAGPRNWLWIGGALLAGGAVILLARGHSAPARSDTATT
jgi:hypothetical protein